MTVTRVKRVRADCQPTSAVTPVCLSPTRMLACLPVCPVSLDGIGSHGAIGGVHAGLDYTLPAGVFFGLYGFYDWQSTELSLTLFEFSGSVGLRDSYGFGGRLGYDWGKAKAYGLVGWRHTDLESPVHVV